jgi:hypothetical protein
MSPKSHKYHFFTTLNLWQHYFVAILKKRQNGDEKNM